MRSGGATAAVARREALLRLHEGVRRKVYPDSKGIPTVGVGRNLRDRGLSDDEIDYLLHHDMVQAEVDVEALCPWAARLDEVRYAVLTELAFTLGRARLAKFAPTLGCVERGEYAVAAQRLLRTKWASDVGPVRAGRLAEMLRTGQWPREVR